MIPTILRFLQDLNDPSSIVLIGFVFVGSYYVVSIFFHYYESKKGYAGIWRKNGPLDVVSSVIWCLSALFLILSLVDLLTRNVLSLGYLLIYYVLFIFLFAFVYNILDWHFHGSFHGLNGGWPGELQCVTMSLQAMTTGGYTSAKPARPLTEFLASVQTLLGIFLLLFVSPRL